MAGPELFEYVDEAMFRKVILALLLISGATLIVCEPIDSVVAIGLLGALGKRSPH
jgi:hypothetical protein